MVKVTLLFQTDSGCNWLAEEHGFGFVSMGEVRRRARFMAQKFWDNNKETAERLVEGWRRDGEEVEMWPLCECEDEKVAKAFNDAFDAMGV